jgi:hypothetical protein
LGDLPADTVVPEASGRIGTPTPDFDLNRPQKPSTVSAAAASSDSAETDTGINYPLAKKDRMKASDFAKRLREAEKMTAKEADEATAKKP